MALKRTFARSINKILNPLERSFQFVRAMARRTYSKAPYIYDELDNIIKSHLITLEKDAQLIHRPDVNSFGNVIAKHLALQLPNVDENQINAIIKDKSKKSMLDMLTVGLNYQGETKDYTKVSKKKLFKRVLIANRGEIALRVIRACRELGIGTVAIYTQQDKDSLAVRFADKKYLIGKTAQSYLNYEVILRVAKKSGADAIHPGYGFLSENTDFAKECEQHRIKFIGPRSGSIRIMGNKDEARKKIETLDIPVIAGTEALADVNEALEAAKKIGYPIMIKAVSGGGGKGMRIVRKEKDFQSAFSSAQQEAHASFHDNRVYLEKYLGAPRHIEFQILADRYGHVIHLGERDCSIQRKHQKLVEESPSSVLDEKLRKKIGNFAIAIAKSVNYEGAGTVEFLLDEKKRFFFMEMNARIQVEHGITELITGVDLIKEQIKIAAGARLLYKQADIVLGGWAVECRINAENPTQDFAPQTGTISNYLPPGGPGIRICSSCHAGHVVSPHYDSMIAKLMCKGRTREEAISRMQRALAEYVIEGVATTLPLHRAILQHKAFLRGEVTTNFIDKYHIIEKLKKERIFTKALSQQTKKIIVSTAVAQYYESRPKKAQLVAWTGAGRKELMQNGQV